MSSIKLTADSSTVNAGTTTQLHARSANSAGRMTDVTATVAWSSGNPSIAAVSTFGTLTGMAAGKATITASLSGVSGVYTAAVGAPAVAGLTLTPKSAGVFTHGTHAYTPFAGYANNSGGDATAATTCSVTPANVATISGGMLTATSAGSYTVTATLATATATVVDAPVTAIAVTPANPSLAGGTTQKFTATATYADGTTADVSKSLNWASSNGALLTIDSNGLATAIGTTGTVTVTVQFGTTSGISTVTLTSAAKLTGLVVTPTSSSIATGSAERHRAMASYSDGSQADVTGQVTWSVVGAASSAARTGSGLQAKARLVAEDGLTAETIAAVDQTGVDQAGSPGMALVQATMGAVTSQSTVIVTSATVQSLTIRASRDLFRWAHRRRFN